MINQFIFDTSFNPLEVIVNVEFVAVYDRWPKLPEMLFARVKNISESLFTKLFETVIIELTNLT